MAAGGSGTLQFAVELADQATMEPTAIQIENTVTISAPASNGPDVDTSNNSYTETTPLEVADLSVTKTESIDPVYLTHDYSYTLVIQNNGPDNATNIALQDSLPAGVTYRGYSAGTASCTFAAPLFSCTLPSLANGATETIVLDVTGATPGEKFNTASISFDQHDPDYSNNEDTETTLVDPADMEITKTVNNAKPTVGDKITFKITVHNNGPDAATNVQLTDAMPAGLQTLAVRITQGSCVTTNNIVCSIGTMANGATVVAEIDAKVLHAGTFKNTATTSINEYDPNPTNNTAVGVEVLGVAKLANTGMSSLLTQVIATVLFVLSTVAVIKTRRSKKVQ